MDKSYFIKLAKVLYRVTELFPQEEPLRFSLRKKANEILSDTVLVFGSNPVILVVAEKRKLFEQITKNIEIISAFLELAETQNWVNQENFSVLKKEYKKIAQEVALEDAILKTKQASKKTIIKNTLQIRPKNSVFDTKTSVATPIANPASIPRSRPIELPIELKDRQKKILQFLKTKGAVQVKDVKEILPDVTKRTLRRDFDLLLKNGLVGKRGDKNTTEYVVR